MATNIEVDLVLKKAIRLLHSSSSNSATELRQIVDNAIKQRYGSEKMLNKTLSKSHLEEEKHFPGRVATPPPQQIAQDDEIINLTTSPEKTLSNSPDTIMDSDSSSAPIISTSAPPILTAADEDVSLKEFGDLNCCVCGEMMFTATNRLIECSKCGALYHQECHKPPISNEDASEDREHQWQCNSCLCPSPATSTAADVVVIPDDNVSIMTATNKVTKSTSAPASSTNRQEQTSSKHRRSSKSSTSSIVTPAINVISASERNSKRSHTHSSSSKTSSRSRHAESSSTSNRRKSTK